MEWWLSLFLDLNGVERRLRTVDGIRGLRGLSWACAPAWLGRLGPTEEEQPILIILTVVNGKTTLLF